MPLFHTTAQHQKIAYTHLPGSAPGVMFCCGFRSDMSSTKATAIMEWCREQGVALTLFDYRGHGQSDGEFAGFTIGGAIGDALEIFDTITSGPQILIGSSMGAWVALHLALERKSLIRGFLGVASAPDFTERLMFPRMTPEQRQELDENGMIWTHSDYSSSDYPITRTLIHEARNHLLLDDVIGLHMPVHLLHGQEDVDVPWETSLILARQLIGEEVTVSLVKSGDHRLNRPEDLVLMLDALQRLRSPDLDNA